MEKNEWIIDGNYQRTLELRLEKCDTVFLLDIPTDICLEGAKLRVGKKREDIPFFEETLNEEFAKKIKNFSLEKLPEIYKILEKNKDKNIIIFKSREEIEEYFNNKVHER